jgi:hypothetical protein
MYPIHDEATIYLVRRDPKMLVEVTTLTRRSFWIFAGASEPIRCIKSKIQEQEGFPPDQQRLIFVGKQMNNKRTVSAYKIRNECTVFLVLRLRGGRRIGIGIGPWGYDSEPSIWPLDWGSSR